MKYYVQDSTKGNQVIIFNNIPELVQYMEGVVQRRFKLNRKQYMQNMIELGYGYDDDNGVTFVSSLSEYFNIGVIQDNRTIKTNIFETARNRKYRSEYGN